MMVVGLLRPFTYLGLALLIMILGIDEFCTMTIGKGTLRIQKAFAILAGITLLVTAILFCDGTAEARWMSLTLIPLLLIPVSFIFTGGISSTDRLAPVYTSFVYIALPIALSPFLMFRGGEFSGKLLLSVFIMIWLSDTGAYCFGSMLGQRPESKKLAPSISPRKSWWGFWGSIISSALAGLVLNLCHMLDFPLVHCIVLGIIVAALCVCGDLVESMWKRRCEVKDSGNVIPGHGGILDRFDSSFIAIPAVTVYLVLFGLI